MMASKNTTRNLCLGVVALLFFAAGRADAVSHLKFMDFEGLDFAESVGEFYNGGTGGAGSGPGMNIGVSYSANTVTSVDTDLRPGGNIGDVRGEDVAVTFNSGSSMTGNVADGFMNGMNFYYTSVGLTKLAVYSEENAGGEELASKILPLATFGTGEFGNFGKVMHYALAFDGIAKSFVFTSMNERPGSLVADKITLGSASPEPVTALLSLLSVTALGAACGRRRRVV